MWELGQKQNNRAEDHGNCEGKTVSCCCHPLAVPPPGNQLSREPGAIGGRNQRLLETEEEEDIAMESREVEAMCWSCPVLLLDLFPVPTLPCSVSQRITFSLFLCPLVSGSLQPLDGPEKRAEREKLGISPHFSQLQVLSLAAAISSMDSALAPRASVVPASPWWPGSFCPLSFRQW
ncbi:uncharacterized protein LOC116460141 [Hylobates moloch]|uniref:uncharacterized protein LOC116460141 n=1 Tax=Hylobates moloch TaxID=81572 RepID=UPI00136400CF|nr:uncharacterized protein LOC116460141 [Hylobates moloch]